MEKAYVAIGSNLGNRKKNCEAALAAFSLHPDIKVLSVSPWYRSKAFTLDQQPQPDYCNGVIELTTTLSAHSLLHYLQEIEKKLGRKKENERWRPRTLDLDLLFYGEQILKEKELMVPHPEMIKRIFVLQPLCDIAPDIIHPLQKQAVRKLLLFLKKASATDELQPWD